MNDTILSMIIKLNNFPKLVDFSLLWEKCSSLLYNFIQKIGAKEIFLRKNLNVFLIKLDALEKEPISFKEGESDLRFQPWIFATEKLLSSVEGDFVEKELIEHRLLALKYRLQEENGGISKNHVKDDLHEKEFLDLKALAIDWKRKHPVYNAPLLSPKEISFLQKIAEYRDFNRLLLRSKVLQDQLFTWSLQNEIDPAILIEFPKSAERLIEIGLDKRLSLYGEEHVKIQIIDGKKVLTLCFEGVHESILDENLEVTFKNNYKLKIFEIFNTFKNKDYDVGNFEMLHQGITNWHTHYLGTFNPSTKAIDSIDLKGNFWENIPPLQKITHRQAMKRYGKSFGAKDWIAAPKATRGNLDLDFFKTHAFIEVAVPNNEGSFSIYGFGKHADKFPQNPWEAFCMITKMVPAVICFPDDNVYYTHRESGFHPYVLSPVEGKKLMDVIKRDIQKGRDENFVYNIESDNCAKWVYHLVRDALGLTEMEDYFKIPMLNCDPKGAPYWLFQAIKCLPEEWQVVAITRFHLPFGAAREAFVEEEGEIVPKSLARHEFFETGEVFLPALLIHRVKGIVLSFEKPNEWIRKLSRIIYQLAKNIGGYVNFMIYELSRIKQMSTAGPIGVRVEPVPRPSQ